MQGMVEGHVMVIFVAGGKMFEEKEDTRNYVHYGINDI